MMLIAIARLNILIFRNWQNQHHALEILYDAKYRSLFQWQSEHLIYAGTNECPMLLKIDCIK